MSTRAQKLQIITQFLQQRASLHRVTTLDEVAKVAGYQLSLNHVRNERGPIRRDQVVHTLNDLAQSSPEGLALTSLVSKFWVNEPPREFAQWAQAAGHTFTTKAQYLAFRDQQMAAAFAAHAPATPAPVSDDDEDPFAEGDNEVAEAPEQPVSLITS